MFIIKSNGWNQFTLFCKSRDFSRFTKKRGIFINECTNSFLSKIAFFKSIAFLKAHCIVQNNMHQFKCLTIAYKKSTAYALSKPNCNVNMPIQEEAKHTKRLPLCHAVSKSKYAVKNQFASNITFPFHHIPAPLQFQKIVQHIILLSKLY